MFSCAVSWFIRNGISSYVNWFLGPTSVMAVSAIQGYDWDVFVLDCIRLVVDRIDYVVIDDTCMIAWLWNVQSPIEGSVRCSRSYFVISLLQQILCSRGYAMILITSTSTDSQWALSFAGKYSLVDVFYLTYWASYLCHSGCRIVHKFRVFTDCSPWVVAAYSIQYSWWIASVVTTFSAQNVVELS